MMKQKRRKTSTYLTEHCIALLRHTAHRMGISRNAVMEMAVRHFADRMGLPCEDGQVNVQPQPVDQKEVPKPME